MLLRLLPPSHRDEGPRTRSEATCRDKLEQAADEAPAVVAERRAFLDRAEAIAAFAVDMSESLRTSQLTETRSLIQTFVK